MSPRPIIAGAVAVAVLGACGGKAGPGDFASEAEDYIEGELAEDQPQMAGLPFTDAQCAEPASTDVGATYACTAVGVDGQTYTFPITIDTEDSLSVAEPTVGVAPTTVAGATTTSTSTTVPG